MSSQKTATSVPIELLRKYDRPGPRYTSYPTVPEWSDKVGIPEYRQALSAASTKTDQPLSIYCHIPFCRERCYYCGCNVVISRKQENVDIYLDLLISEIEKTAELLGGDRPITQFHFGGGTPTFIGNEGLGRIITRVGELFTYADKCEKSIEIDPRVTTHDNLDALVAQGFNRVSMGIQDFNLEVQTAIGRKQPLESVENILSHCRKLGFKGINFDLIYGLPLQTPETYTETLRQAIKMRPDRLAVYSFAYLPEVRSNQMKIKKEELPVTEVKYSLFARAIEELTGAGYRQIGMDHFALPEDELSLAQSDGRLHRNFMGYTVQSAPEMIGVGMSSIGYINNAFFQNISMIDSYKNSIRENDFAIYRGKQLLQDDLIRQYVINSLMCNFRLDFDRLAEKMEVNFGEYFRNADTDLAEFIDDGLVTKTDTGLLVTDVGRTFVRNIAMVFDAYLDKPGSKKTIFSRTI